MKENLSFIHLDIIPCVLSLLIFLSVVVLSIISLVTLIVLFQL